MNHSRLIFLAALTVASCLVCAPAHGRAITAEQKTALWEKNPAPSGRKLSGSSESPDFAMEAEGYGYESAMGRAYWVSRDPIGERGGMNVYLLLENAAISLVDTLGLQPAGKPKEDGNPDATADRKAYHKTCDQDLGKKPETKDSAKVKCDYYTKAAQVAKKCYEERKAYMEKYELSAESKKAHQDQLDQVDKRMKNAETERNKWCGQCKKEEGGMQGKGK